MLQYIVVGAQVVILVAGMRSNMAVHWTASTLRVPAASDFSRLGGRIMSHQHFQKNVSGPFYTTGECLACGLPEDLAPECFAPLTDDNQDTYFLRQPQTDEETARVCEAAAVCCTNAIRYAGNDPTIISQLGNRPDHCDFLLPGGPMRLSWETDEQWELVKRAAAQREITKLATRPWWQFWS